MKKKRLLMYACASAVVLGTVLLYVNIVGTDISNISVVEAEEADELKELTETEGQIGVIRLVRIFKPVFLWPIIVG